jgi:multimeric flavodoxin WrbA
MVKVVAVNGSPRLENGMTGKVLAAFIRGVESHDAEVDLVYPSQLKIKPCACGHLYCWKRSPGECVYQDSMQSIYPMLKQADFLVLATPVYIPIPGEMQNFINRLTPLLDPRIRLEEGRTRIQFREDVRIKNISLVVTGGWWEVENADTVVRIVEEMAAHASVTFGGAVVRPHAYYLWHKGEETPEGRQILENVELAGRELILSDRISKETLEVISRPLITKEEFFVDW